MNNLGCKVESSIRTDKSELDLYSDEYLFLLTKNGNTEAFDCIIERYKNPLMNYVFYSIFDYDKSQDVVKRTFIHLFRKRYSGKNIIKVSKMLFAQARSLIRKEIFRRRLESLSGKEHCLSYPFSLSGSPILQAFKKLNSRSREALILRDIEGMCPDEIAAITRRSVKDTKTIIYEAGMELRENMPKSFFLDQPEGVFENCK